MRSDNLGSKHTVVLHSCLIQNERYDLVITPHRRTIGYIIIFLVLKKNRLSFS